MPIKKRTKAVTLDNISSSETGLSCPCHSNNNKEYCGCYGYTCSCNKKSKDCHGNGGCMNKKIYKRYGYRACSCHNTCHCHADGVYQYCNCKTNETNKRRL